MQNAFVLDEGCAADLLGNAPASARWVEFAHAAQRERGLLMWAGERLKLPGLVAPIEPVLWMRCMRGLPRIGKDGIDVEVWGGPAGSVPELLASQRITNAQPKAGLRELLLDLPLAPGTECHLELRVGSSPKWWATKDRLALLGLVVCSRSELPLHRARTQHAWRLQNEIAHFSTAYASEFYKDRRTDHCGQTAAQSPPRAMPTSMSGSGESASQREQVRDKLRERLKSVEPNAGEQAFGYAHRMLGLLIPDQAPDFAARLRILSAARGGRPLRVLSLCAGEAAIEARLLKEAGVDVQLTLIDVNAGLLEKAAARMPGNVTVDRMVGDANQIGPEIGRFDVVNITSGLHHLVELERALAAIATMLLPGGEFWLIGEQVGRNGNQLWPEAIRVAERVFAAWPPQKRRNRNTGALDTHLPDLDFSAGCFEGIRSQDILEQLERHFLPIQCYVRNAFLWRLVDAAYSENFDLTQATDRDLVREAVLEEVLHWACGGRGTEMHAAFRSKWASLAARADET